MKRFREIVLNTTAPESPDVVWAKPEDGNMVLYVCDGGEWKKITSVDGTIPTISTNITTDATSDTKTASPKAVKTYVDDIVGNIETLLAQI